MAEPLDEEAEGRAALRASAGRAAGWLVGIALGRAQALYFVLFLVAAGTVLSLAWSSGPARLVLAREMEAMTERAPGRIQRSWAHVAFDAEGFDAAGGGWNWRAAGRLRACAEIAVAARPEPAVVVLCSRSYPLHGEWSPVEERTLATGVPFAWDRDERGLPVVELRVSAGDLAWLASKAAEQWTDPTLETADEALLVQLDDDPLSLLVRAWSESEAERSVEMAYAPGAATRALPTAALVDRRTALLGMIPSLGGLVFGGLIWVAVMLRWGADHHPALAWGLALGSLAAIPWWGAWLPGTVRSVSVTAGQMFDELTRNASPMLDALERTTPERVAAAGDEARVWTLAASRYAPTLGRVGLARPQPPPADAGAALAAIVAQVGDHVARTGDADVAGLFERLAVDDEAGRNAVGVAFVAAARTVYLDEGRSRDARRAALRFLDQALTQPVRDPLPGSATFDAELDQWALLLDFPVDYVRNQAAWVFERVERPVPGRP